ncbi:hypothetical protein [Nocardioides sp. KR10-350]|uniref:hypothetical protein n=1 Tax=Nocardioides cheoyonin TaxID=3156615 RepID=UPI0032B4FF19
MPTPLPTTTRIEGLQEPVDRGVERLLRRAVLAHASGERRRQHQALLHVGVPGGRELVFPLLPGESIDQALDADVVAAMRLRTGPPTPLVWLTRAGDLDLQDVDARWLAAARQAYAEAGVPLVFVVVNRHGWRDPRTGVRRDWKRLRPRSD